MRFSINKPEFTMIPNVLLDNMHHFTDAQFRLAMFICRQTFGWIDGKGGRRLEYKMSISFLAKGTGMSHQGVINAYHGLSEKSVVYRVADGDSFRYGLVVNDVDSQSTPLTHPINAVDGLVVNAVDTNKESIKETIKQISEGEASNPKSNSPSLPESPHVPPTPLKSGLQKRVEKIFKRRETTAWDKSETTAWKTAYSIVKATSEPDFVALEAFYAAPQTETFARKTLATLLNNWNGEVQRAIAWKSLKSNPPKACQSSIQSGKIQINKGGQL